MTDNKVYQVKVKCIGERESDEIDMHTWRHIGRKIALLSAAVKEPLYFHDNVNFIDYEMSHFIECSSAFLDRLRNEFFIEAMNELKPGLTTQRSIWRRDHFERYAPPAPPVKKPKFGP